MELPLGIRRITTPLPTRPGHVHSYLLPGEDGWTLVDTGIGLPDAQEIWAASLDGAEVARIFVTHFHPDHVGAAADVAELTGAPVSQGELDYAQCELVWGNEEWPRRIADWFLTHGVPSEITEELIGSGNVYRPVHPLSARPGARRRRRPARRLGARRRARARRRPALPLQGPGARLGRPPARADHADGRPLAGEPPRSARGLTSSP